MGVRYESKEITRVEKVRAALVCDYCGKENIEYGVVWGFPPPRWVHIKWGSDPLYSPSGLMCDECAAAHDIKPPVKQVDTL